MTADDLPPLVLRLLEERDRRYEERFTSITETVSAAAEAADRATTKAETATEERFRGVNEFRAALDAATSKNITRTEVDAIRDALGTEIRVLREATETRLRGIENRIEKAEGTAQGLGLGWKALIAVSGLVSLLLAVYVALVG